MYVTYDTPGREGVLTNLAGVQKLQHRHDAVVVEIGKDDGDIFGKPVFVALENPS